MQGAKAYILPAIAALLLLGWWLLGPDVGDDDPAPAPATEAEPAPVTPARPKGPLDTALDEALAGCGDAARAGVSSLTAEVGPDEGGKARIDALEVVPATASGPVVDCLRALAGTSLDAKAPVAPVTRRRSYP